MKPALTLLLTLMAAIAAAQNVGIGTAAPHTSAQLDVTSATKGLLAPRMTAAQRINITTPATGLLVYQNDAPAGFYYYTGSSWVALTSQTTGWSTTGNAGTNPATNFIGTTDANDLVIKVNNQPSGLIQYQAGVNVPTTSFGYKNFVNKSPLSGNNTAFGFEIMQNTIGGFNTAMGVQALYANGNGSQSAGIGYKSLHSNTDGDRNTGLGAYSGYYNTIGNDNVAVGYSALYGDSMATSLGSNNVAVGAEALAWNRTADGNTAIGYRSMYNNTKGTINPFLAVGNTAIGQFSLMNNSIGYQNVAIGRYSMMNAKEGINNVAVGISTLVENISGTYNTALGAFALYQNIYGASNTALGANAALENRGGLANTAVGVGALQSNKYGDRNVALGAAALYSDSATTTQIAIGPYSLYNNQVGDKNMAIGDSALFSNTSGNYNLAVGHKALNDNSLNILFNYESSHNTGIGYWALTQNSYGYNNTALGYKAGFNNREGFDNTFIGDSARHALSNPFNVTVVGAGAVATGNNKVLLGNTAVSRIESYGGYFTISDGRFKKNITANVPGIDFINRLTPVTYQLDWDAYEQVTGIHHTPGYDRNGRLVSASIGAAQTGFIAQDVLKAAQQLGYSFNGVMAPDGEKDNYSVNYAAFVPSLVKAVQQLSATNLQLQRENELLKEQVKQIRQKLGME
jgi:trimeric autotransporter adhesin